MPKPTHSTPDPSAVHRRLRRHAVLASAGLLTQAVVGAPAWAQAAVPSADASKKKPDIAPAGIQKSATNSVANTPSTSATPPAACTADWDLWTSFRNQIVAHDGRVIDADTPRAHTVSEAQAYGLFFALVANDRASFDKLLEWTQNNLAAGDLTQRLPAWQWGRRDDGQWTVIDANSASDADVWIVYALGEAGRLWREPRYTKLSTTLAERLLRESVVDMPGLGPTLLPAPKGFSLGGYRWRLNPSYVPLQLMRWLSKHAGPTSKKWAPVLASSRALLLGSAPKGFSPDWTLYSPKAKFESDASGPEQVRGGYNAIRTYLWAGLLHPSDPDRSALLKLHEPMGKLIHQLGFVPEYVDTTSGLGTQSGPPGFAAAVLPFLQAGSHTDALQTQRQRLAAKPVRSKSYYEQALQLFALGGMHGRYRFAADGRLQVPWAMTPAKPCLT